MEILILSKYWYWYSLLALGGLAVGIYSYIRSYPPLNRYWRILLAVFRSVSVVLVGFLLIEPVINAQKDRTVKSRLAVVIDDTASMGQKFGAVSRIDLADSLISRELSGLHYPYDIFTFSGRKAGSGDLPGDEDIGGDATSIADALKSVESARNFNEYGAMLLITDGANNLGADPVDAAARLNIPVSTLTVGEEKPEPNVSISDVVFPPVVYSGDKVKIETEISAKGIKNGRSRVFLKESGKTIKNTAIDLPSEGRSVKVDFEIEAPDPGNIEYHVSTPVLDNETETADNERIFILRVLKNKINVLLTASSLNWEFKFVKQALSKFDDFDVDAVYPESPGRFSSPGLPRGLDGLSRYDVIILVNSSPDDLRISIGDLENYVSAGKSLVYIAGSEYKSNIRRFGHLLPFEIQNISLVEGEFFFEPAPGYRQHAAISINDNPDENKKLWNSLPPLSAIVIGIDPAGEVLLEARSSAGLGETYPILITGSSDKGRVIALTGFPLWKSYFGAANLEGLSDLIPEFWRNLLRWASAEEEGEKFKVLADKDVYRLGEPVAFTAYLNDESNSPKSGALVTVSIYPEGQELELKEVVLAQADNGLYKGETESPGSGNYEFRAVAVSYGDTIGEYSGQFTVENFSLEMSRSSPDYGLTRRIAEISGGIAYNSENIDDFSENLTLNPYIETEFSQVKLFGTPTVLAVILILLCIEWGLRKRFRLP